MIDFIRLFQLSGILLEAMTPSQAKAVFVGYGAKDEDLVGDNLKKTRNKLAKKLHSDVGGNDEAMKAINAAYDVLVANPLPRMAQSSGGYQQPSGGVPAWQTDSMAHFNTISRMDYRDLNYFKMKMWELSGRSKEKWTIWAFDGRYFRGSVTVFGNKNIFPEMAKAMVQWDVHFNIRAVFVQTQTDPAISLIWLDGKDVNPPIYMEHDSPNMNPGNDGRFINWLSNHLEDISTEISK